MTYTTQRIKSALPLYPGQYKVKHRALRNTGGGTSEDNDLYTRKIAELRLELEMLNILDHPLRIIEICNQIRKLQKLISGSDN